MNTYPIAISWNSEYTLTLSVIPMARATWDWESRIGRRVRLRDLHILSAVVRWIITASLLTAVALAVRMKVGGSGVDLPGLYALGRHGLTKV